jgi:hypothetical protein
MSDPCKPTSGSSSETKPSYRIIRKGSRYNILGPEGRIFVKYRSARIVGPRWEELTRTPWPYTSSAYTRGHRLWELGLIARHQVGKRNVVVLHDKPDHPPAQWKGGVERQKTRLIRIKVKTSLALPAPCIDLQEHIRLMQALRHKPVLLFKPQVQQALRHEVEYHRPQARWAAHLLKLLARYERQHRRPPMDAAAITARHIAWQEQQMRSI